MACRGSDTGHGSAVNEAQRKGCEVGKSSKDDEFEKLMKNLNAQDPVFMQRVQNTSKAVKDTPHKVQRSLWSLMKALLIISGVIAVSGYPLIAAIAAGVIIFISYKHKPTFYEVQDRWLNRKPA